MQSRVQARLPLVSLSVFWQPVCCPGESRSPLPSLRLGTASSSQSTRSGVQYQETDLEIVQLRNIKLIVVPPCCAAAFFDVVDPRHHMATAAAGGPVARCD